MTRFKLFPFQTTGVSFLLAHERALLADEMGLGKTVQALEAARLSGVKNILIVCPASLKLMWAREIQKWFEYAPVGWEIVSWNYLQKKKKVETLINRDWDVVIADEAHAIKNFKSKTCRGFMKLLSTHKGYCWLLTGTPATRNGQDYYPYVEICEPGVHGTLEAFSAKYCDVEQMNISYVSSQTKKKIRRQIVQYTGVKQSKRSELREIFSRFKLRRLKKDVLEQLPEVIEQEIPVEIDPLIVGESLSIDSEDIKKRIAEGRELPGHIMKVLQAIGLAKVSTAIDYLTSVGREQIIAFCCHHDVVNKVMNGLSDNGITCARVTGKESDTEKQANVDAFQKGECQVLVCNVRAGGTGYTLHAASKILFVEQYWSPAIMQQAVGRIDRIGQKALKLHVTHLIGAGTIDEVIREVLREKSLFMKEVMGDE